MASGALLAALAHATMGNHLMLKIQVVLHSNPCRAKTKQSANCCDRFFYKLLLSPPGEN